MPRTVIGIMGPGGGSTGRDRECAYQLGKLIADEGWVLLTGGRPIGVMEAASKGAHEHGGLTVGVLPDPDVSVVSQYVDVPIATGMGHARNAINVLSSRVVIACGTGLGTTSEIALALKSGRQLILMHATDEVKALFEELAPEQVHQAQTPHEAIDIVKKLL